MTYNIPYSMLIFLCCQAGLQPPPNADEACTRDWLGAGTLHSRSTTMQGGSVSWHVTLMACLQSSWHRLILVRERSRFCILTRLLSSAIFQFDQSFITCCITCYIICYMTCYIICILCNVLHKMLYNMLCNMIRHAV
jgi:hypothetical protein